MNLKTIFLISLFFVLAFPIISIGQPVGSPCIIADNCNAGLFCVNFKCAECESGDPDADGDGYASILCGGDDCDDSDSNRYPGNAEVCDNNHDEDCDLSTLGPDLDRDGFFDERCCNIDGDVENCGTDCDDFNPSILPGAIEVCNGKDDNCNGHIDDDVFYTQYLDMDKDGHGDDGVPMVQQVCPGTEGYSGLGNDCDDNNPAIKPGTTVCMDSLQIMVCNADGDFEGPFMCTGGCIMQPNGTGLCRGSGGNRPN